MSEVKIIPESELAGKKVPADITAPIFYFKLVGVGSETISKTDGDIVPVVQEQQGFFVSADPNELRDVLHEVIDRACNAANIPTRREDEDSSPGN